MVSRKVEGMGTELVRLRIEERNAGEIMRHHVAQARRDGSQELILIQMRDDSVVYFEQEPRPVSFAHSLLLRAQGSFEIQRVFDAADLLPDGCPHFDFAFRVSPGLAMLHVDHAHRFAS